MITSLRVLIFGFSNTPDKRFKKTIVKELTVNIDDTRDCYVGFTAYLHIEWNKKFFASLGDYYNREFDFGVNWTIEHTKDDYHFVRTSKEGLDKACSYWYRAEDTYEYGACDPELVKEYSNKYNMERTSSYISNESTPKWYEYDVDDDYDGIDIEKELELPKNAIKKTYSNTNNSAEYNKIIESISKRNVGTQPVVEKDPNEEVKNKLKKMHFDKYDTNESEEFIKEFCKLNPYYAKLGYKSLNNDLKVWSKKWPESVTHYPDGSKFIGKHTSWPSVSKGTYFDINGEVYEGEWMGANRHGKGKIIYPNGNVLECQYSDNKLHGKCILHKLDGEDIEQEYSNGTLIDGSH